MAMFLLLFIGYREGRFRQRFRGSIKAEILPIALATLLSTIIVLIITGHTHQVVSKGENKVREKINIKKHE